ncbi:unnamed protein product [Allacma fusca]|uniref:Uncharacterized protein n=1 Tax=Allacma fusca TaxID=39272 RepID=A0A8J2JL30_9HEXA|nr:unnamed protein product [Allacma fusca]
MLSNFRILGRQTNKDTCTDCGSLHSATEFLRRTVTSRLERLLGVSRCKDPLCEGYVKPIGIRYGLHETRR